MIESRLECGFEKMSQTLSELSDKLKNSSETQETLEQLTKWKQLDRLPCMCCADKGDNSFDKSFFSKEEGKELLASHSETNLMAHSESLQCLDLVAREMSSFERAQPYCLLLTQDLLPTSIAKSELISFASDENTLDCVSSLDTCKETSFLISHHSEPVLSQGARPKTLYKLRPLGPSAVLNSSKSLSQLWLDRLKLSNLSHLVKKS